MTEQKKTVLIVEDHISTRNFIANALKSAGYGVLETEDAAHAIGIALSEKVDLVMMDVMLPRMDGFTACRKLKEGRRTAGIPVIMCTARGSKEDVVAAAEAGADGYIIKPVQRKTMLEKVAQWIGYPSAGEAKKKS